LSTWGLYQRNCQGIYLICAWVEFCIISLKHSVKFQLQYLGFPITCMYQLRNRGWGGVVSINIFCKISNGKVLVNLGLKCLSHRKPCKPLKNVTKLISIRKKVIHFLNI
jgi:hypothetical protein